MHCPPDSPEDAQNILKTHNNQRRRKKKKWKSNKPNIRNNFFKKKFKFAASMSSWAENFTLAATWQLKHQVAYWKAKATSLEYENKVLHDIIRKSHGHPSSEHGETMSDSETELHSVGTSKDHQVIEEDDEGDDIEVSEEFIESLRANAKYKDHQVIEEDDEGDDIEVSEEFIEFLRANAKYKEDARLEREQLKAKNDFEQLAIEEMEAGPSQVEDTSLGLKDLYGAEWQRIGALEMSLHTQFVHDCDKEKPAYWPNIPFNFNFS